MDKLIQLASPNSERINSPSRRSTADSYGIPSLVDSFDRFDFTSTRATQAYDANRRWLYGYVLLSDHLACLDILTESELEVEDFRALFQDKAEDDVVY